MGLISGLFERLNPKPKAASPRPQFRESVLEHARNGRYHEVANALKESHPGLAQHFLKQIQDPAHGRTAEEAQAILRSARIKQIDVRGSTESTALEPVAQRFIQGGDLATAKRIIRQYRDPEHHEELAWAQKLMETLEADIRPKAA